MRPLADILEEYEFLDKDDRYRLLIELGRELEPMPDALKTDATLVRGCSARVWVYPTRLPDGRLHFLADSDAHITKGIVALILSAVQDRSPDEVAGLDVVSLSSNRSHPDRVARRGRSGPGRQRGCARNASG